MPSFFPRRNRNAQRTQPQAPQQSPESARSPVLSTSSVPGSDGFGTPIRSRFAKLRSRVGGKRAEGSRDANLGRETPKLNRRESIDGSSLLSFRLFGRNQSFDDFPAPDTMSTWAPASSVAETPLDTHLDTEPHAVPAISDAQFHEQVRAQEPPPVTEILSNKTEEVAPAQAESSAGQDQAAALDESHDVQVATGALDEQLPVPSIDVTHSGMHASPPIAELPSRYRGSVLVGSEAEVDEYANVSTEAATGEHSIEQVQLAQGDSPAKSIAQSTSSYPAPESPHSHMPLSSSPLGQSPVLPAAGINSTELQGELHPLDAPRTDTLPSTQTFASLATATRDDEMPASASMFGNIGRRGWDMMRTLRPPLAGSGARKILSTRASDQRLGDSRRRSFFVGGYSGRDTPSPGSSVRTWLDWIEAPGAPGLSTSRSSRFRSLRPPSALSTSTSMQNMSTRRDENSVFGAPLHVAVEQTRIEPRSNDESERPAVLDRLSARRQMLPRVVVRCIESLEKWGIDEEGLYRIPGRSLHTSRLRQLWDSPTTELHMDEISPAELDIHSVCSVLKMYLRELPERLAPRDVAAEFDKVCSELLAIPVSRQVIPGNGSNDEMSEMRRPQGTPELHTGGPAVEQAIARLAPLMQRLPECQWYLLRELADHLAVLVDPDVVARTKMTLPNLTLVLAPTLQISGAMCMALVQLRKSLFTQETCPLRDTAEYAASESQSNAFSDNMRPLGLVPPVVEVSALEEAAEGDDPLAEEEKREEQCEEQEEQVQEQEEQEEQREQQEEQKEEQQKEQEEEQQEEQKEEQVEQREEQQEEQPVEQQVEQREQQQEEQREEHPDVPVEETLVEQDEPILAAPVCAVPDQAEPDEFFVSPEQLTEAPAVVQLPLSAPQPPVMSIDDSGLSSGDWSNDGDEPSPPNVTTKDATQSPVLTRHSSMPMADHSLFYAAQSDSPQ